MAQIDLLLEMLLIDEQEEFKCEKEKLLECFPRHFIPSELGFLFYLFIIIFYFYD